MFAWSCLTQLSSVGPARGWDRLSTGQPSPGLSLVPGLPILASDWPSAGVGGGLSGRVPASGHNTGNELITLI